MLKILFFGDMVGRPAREALRRVLPELRAQYHPDFVIVNVDNLAHGLGVTASTIEELRLLDVDCFTNGDHAFDRAGSEAVYDDVSLPLLRPANFVGAMPGEGARIISRGQKKLLVVSLLGRVFIDEPTSNPFTCVDSLLTRFSAENVDGIFIDFHAEATSEKIGLKHFLDGRVSAIVGTHTHVPTADEEITAKGTAFLSDVGMVGPQNSVLGADTATVVNSFVTEEKFSYQLSSDTTVVVNAVCLTLDDQHRATDITRVQKIVTLEHNP